MRDTGWDNLPQAVIRRRRQILRKRKSFRKLTEALLTTMAAVFIVFGILAGLGMAQGDSMSPTLPDGTLVLIWRMDKQYHKADMVFFRRANGGNEVVKRIVALPGDKVDIRGGQLWVNDKVVKEPYIYQSTEVKKDGIGFPLVLAADEYFVLGDHRAISKDSRNYGPVHKREIDGRIILYIKIGL